MRLFLIPLMLIAFVWSSPTRAEEPSDSIRSVIERQLAAFQANDLDEAFQFASPAIQRMFGDPQNFGRMVESGYPMVWRPAGYRMLKLLETESGLVQVVEFEDSAGVLHEAGYLMKQIDGVWRIAGVHVRKRPGVGT